ncbi:MAG: hypothetical protein U9P14_06725 [Gemmatimonadota bacterium]|nr:hypothetical protein [Gemmatimonadota bacterium]
MDQVIAILQARLDSGRLPAKVMADLCGKPLISHIIERLYSVPGIDLVVLAVPGEDFAIMRPVAEQYGARIHPGPGDNVLERFYSTANRFESSFIVRATGDNPLIDTFMLERAVSEALSGKWDMVGTSGLPLGCSAEVFPTGLLDMLYRCGTEDYHREHVTTYLYERENEFHIKRIEAPRHLRAPALRLTVDAPEDLILVRQIYKKLYQPGSLVNLGEVISFLKESPELASMNRHVKQRNWREHAASAAIVA